MLGFLGTTFLVVSFGQSRGLIELDTKLPFVMKPLAYMQASNHLWNQNVFGSAEALLFRRTIALAR